MIYLLLSLAHSELRCFLFETKFSSRCVQAQWYHRGGEPLGRPWQRGDVLGCLVDMAERTMVVTLNGEVLFNDRGSELAAKDFDIRDGVEEFLTLTQSLNCLLN